MITSPSRW